MEDGDALSFLQAEDDALLRQTSALRYSNTWAHGDDRFNPNYKNQGANWLPSIARKKRPFAEEGSQWGQQRQEETPTPVEEVAGARGEEEEEGKEEMVVTEAA